MIYAANPLPGVLVRKVNRFLAHVTLNGKTVSAHIPNSGRLTELMAPGGKVILEPATNPERKTAYTLKSVWYAGRWVCVDSTIPNALAERLALEWGLPVFHGYNTARRETTIGHHRFDLRLDGPRMRPMIVEVKSVTLVKDHVALFPDAPTQRGASHLRSLAAMKGEYERMVLFTIQRSDARLFRPNINTDPDFAEALVYAAKAGVHICAVKCSVGKSSIRVTGPVEIDLGRAPAQA